jgi:two-component system, OmpR family, phosphate regulon sensor histidine kinase PhoR
MSDAWTLTLAAVLGLVVLAAIVLYLKGYRLERVGRAAGPRPPVADNKQAPSPFALAQQASVVLSRLEDGVIVVGDGRLVTYLNASAERIMGAVAGTWMGRPFIEVVRDHECDDLLRRCVETGQEQSAMVKLQRSKQLLSVRAFRGTDRDKYIVLLRDLTERQRIEDMRRDLVSNVAHEFRTPIASIRLLIETLLGGAMEDPAVSRDFLRKVDVESEKLQLMTDDLAKLFALENTDSSQQKMETNVGTLLAGAVERLREQAERKDVNIDVRIEEMLPAVAVDRAGLESVVMNLLQNAIKFNRQGGSVAVTARKEEASIQVCFEDTGVGVAAADLPRIFERFYKADKSRNSDGAGLGLAIARHIVDSFGGRIWVDSMEGKGSKFCFTLPIDR